MCRSRVLSKCARVFIVLLLLVLIQTVSAAPVKLVFMFRGGELQRAMVEYWKAEFEKKNPDITIEWREATGDWMQKMPVWIATGVGPDVFEMWGSSAVDWAEKGLLLDLTPYVKRDFKEQDIQDFFPIAWEASELRYGPKKGMRFGIPSYVNVFVLFYNKDYFAESGLLFPPDMDKQGNWTWDTLITVDKKLTRTDGTKITRWALDDDSLYYPTARGAGWIHAAGGKWFNYPDNPTEFTGDSPEVIKALTYLQELTWVHRLVSPIDVRSQVDFRKGNAAMNLWLGSVRLKELEETPLKFDWDIGPRPMGPKSRGYYLSSDMFGINAYTKHPEEAWRFVKYLTSTEGMIGSFKVMGRGPVRRSALAGFLSMFPKRAAVYHAYGMMDGVLSPETFFVKASQVASIINNVVRNEIAMNKKPASQALAEIADAIKALYE